MKRGRCGCSRFCRNPAMVVIDFKAPPGASAGLTGWRTKRVCVPYARALLADMVANQEEADAIRKEASDGKR